jgi:hypothetical protein
MVGWGQLKDSLSPLLILGFKFYKSYLYPHLYPLFSVYIQVLDALFQGLLKIGRML